MDAYRYIDLWFESWKTTHPPENREGFGILFADAMTEVLRLAKEKIDENSMSNSQP